MKKLYYNSIRNERGITFAETVISLLLLSLVMITLFHLSSLLLPSLAKDLSRGKDLRWTVKQDRVLKETFMKISPPLWLSEYEWEYKENQWIFPWYEGEEDLYLIIEQSETSLILRPGDSPAYVLPASVPIEVEALIWGTDGQLICPVKREEKLRYYPLGGSPVYEDDLP